MWRKSEAPSASRLRTPPTEPLRPSPPCPPRRGPMASCALAGRGMASFGMASFGMADCCMGFCRTACKARSACPQTLAPGVASRGAAGAAGATRTAPSAPSPCRGPAAACRAASSGKTCCGAVGPGDADCCMGFCRAARNARSNCPQTLDPDVASRGDPRADGAGADWPAGTAASVPPPHRGPVAPCGMACCGAAGRGVADCCIGFCRAERKAHSKCAQTLDPEVAPRGDPGVAGSGVADCCMRSCRAARVVPPAARLAGFAVEARAARFAARANAIAFRHGARASASACAARRSAAQPRNAGPAVPAARPAPGPGRAVPPPLLTGSSQLCREPLAGAWPPPVDPRSPDQRSLGPGSLDPGVAAANAANASWDGCSGDVSSAGISDNRAAISAGRYARSRIAAQYQLTSHHHRPDIQPPCPLGHRRQSMRRARGRHPRHPLCGRRPGATPAMHPAPPVRHRRRTAGLARSRPRPAARCHIKAGIAPRIAAAPASGFASGPTGFRPHRVVSGYWTPACQTPACQALWRRTVAWSTPACDTPADD